MLVDLSDKTTVRAQIVLERNGEIVLDVDRTSSRDWQIFVMNMCNPATLITFTDNSLNILKLYSRLSLTIKYNTDIIYIIYNIQSNQNRNDNPA
jgi:hypothetical protein